MSLASDSHRAALRFLRGGLVAVVALLVPSQFGVVSRDAPAAALVVAFLRVVIPALGFAAGGAFGATALGRGRRGSASFGAGLFLSGLVLSLASGPMQGLTGFEDRLAVILFSGATTAAAFALGGGTAGVLAGGGGALPLALGFGAGGAIGGVTAVLPAVSASWLNAWPADAQLFARLACSLAGLLAPFAVGGAVAGRVVAGTEARDQ